MRQGVRKNLVHHEREVRGTRGGKDQPGSLNLPVQEKSCRQHMGGKEGKKVGGVQSVAEILNAVDRATEEEVLSEIEEDSAQLAEDIRNLMFVFEDCKNIDDRGVREMLKEISNEDLTLALRGASDELKEKFFKNMSERAGNMVREELEFMGPTKLADVEEAQQNIVKIVRRLEGEGKLAISRGTGDVFV